MGKNILKRIIVFLHLSRWSILADWDKSKHFNPSEPDEIDRAFQPDITEILEHGRKKTKGSGKIIKIK